MSGFNRTVPYWGGWQPGGLSVEISMNVATIGKIEITMKAYKCVQ